ncbi:uncharacterized protein PHACADRAFT_208084 [Phanerochaete carnosa HHB-10118-sp]|uniref:NAD(P)-binding protein n=1 Tax=Phanerochaete carnosa (strain HHB-10118-sp) TaxID=650164 RepID=K5V2Y6_PHACS|nr:uncharacterized protein PHACADRAFT_208084 [Phanerochaete carnosa HHB-10118-sp]EKM56916.1 hypothetical protein PHACADRAFT_208084 [Phanerochaete carnosa HHB-10118-sp]
MPPKSLVWFITGTSTGLGKALAEVVLSRGDRVIATARSLDTIKHLESPSCKTLQLDITDSFDAIQAKVKEGFDVWDRVDVLVNNAGLGSLGITEEMGATGYMKAFNINLFAAMNITIAILPFLREQKSGTIVLMGSRHAWKCQFPYIGAYASSKAAIHAWGECLSTEVKPFGIHVLIAQPGAHRTGIIATAQAHWLGGDTIEDYDSMREAAAKRFRNQHGKQPNDSMKSMSVLADVVRGEGPAKGKQMPLWLVLGKDAEEDLRANVQQRLENLDEWKDVTRNVVVDSDDAVLI